MPIFHFTVPGYLLPDAGSKDGDGGWSHGAGESSCDGWSTALIKYKRLKMVR